MPVGSCIVEADGSRAILNGVAAAAERLGIPAYDEDRRRGLLRYAILRMGWKRDEVMLTVVTSRREIPHRAEFVAALRAVDPRIVCIAQNINPRPGNAILGNETRILDGTDHMVDELLGCTFAISPGAFYQTIPQQTETLYRLAIDGMELRDGDVLMDAYCGSGTIGIAAAAQARSDGADVELIGVERNQAGIRDAKRNARLNDLSGQCRFVAQDATAFMVEAARRGERIDVLSIDPPRAGSTPEFLEAACALGPRRIVYVSCGPPRRFGISSISPDVDGSSPVSRRSTCSRTPRISRPWRCSSGSGGYRPTGRDSPPACQRDVPFRHAPLPDAPIVGARSQDAAPLRSKAGAPRPRRPTPGRSRRVPASRRYRRSGNVHRAR